MPERVVIVEDEVEVNVVPFDRDIRGAVTVIRRLTSLGLWDWIRENVHLRRRAHSYEVVDVVLFLVAYFSSSDHKGGLTKFAERTANSVGRSLAALAGRMKWMVQSGVSRALSAVCEDCLLELSQVLQWLWPKARALHDLMSIGHQDSFGRLWLALHFDGSIVPVRQRQLPKGDDLPKARRRLSKVAAPGHTGRKRANTVTQRTMTQQSHGGWWVGVSVEPGNGDLNRMSLAGAKAAASHADEDKPRTLTVFVSDGGGGGWATLRAAIASGLYGLTRCAMYRWLNRQDVRQRLMEPGWFAVPDSRSGPSRSAKDLGVWQDATHHVFRVIVSRFGVDKAQTKRGGAGYRIGDQHYELFMTDVPADAWPAQNVVTLYYDRCGQENSFAALNRRYDLGNILSDHPEGQALVTLVGLLVWNVEVLLGAEALGPWDDQHPALAPVPRQDHEIPPPTVENECATEPRFQSLGDGDVTPSVTAEMVGNEVAPEQEPTCRDDGDVAKASEIEEEFSRTLARWAAAHPEWKVEGLALICPAGVLLPSCVRNWTSTSARIRLRGPRSTCGECKLRQQCSSASDPAFRKEILLTVKASEITEAILSRLDLDKRQLPSSEGSLPATIANLEVLPLQQVQPGPFACQMSRLSVAELFHLHDDSAARMLCAISVERPPQNLAPLPPAITPTPSIRQRRRKTFAERLAWNDLPAGTTVRISTIRVRPQEVQSPVNAREAA